MLKIHQFWTLTALGVIALALTVANVWLSLTNGGMQAQASTRAQYIQQSIALESLYRDVVQALADRAVKTRDDQIRDLLAAEGFKVNFDPAPGRPAAGGKQ